jgi:hypothetical protein
LLSIDCTNQCYLLYSYEQPSNSASKFTPQWSISVLAQCWYIWPTEMKKFSHKDIIVALGVVVAAIILIASLYFNEGNARAESVKIVPDKKVKPAAILKAVIQKLGNRTSL